MANVEFERTKGFQADAGQDIEAFAKQEGRLVDLAQSGNEEASASLYSYYLPRLYSYTVTRVGFNYAEDLAQNVAIKVAVTDINKYHKIPDIPFSSWVFVVAHNEVASFYRREASRGFAKPLSELSKDPISDGGIDHIADRLDLADTVENLSDTYKRVIADRIIRGYSVSETAERMGKTETNIKGLKHKAIKRINELSGVAA